MPPFDGNTASAKSIREGVHQAIGYGAGGAVHTVGGFGRSGKERSAFELGEALQEAGLPIRITILDEEGNVLGDSEKRGDHRKSCQPPEIVEAREEGCWV